MNRAGHRARTATIALWCAALLPLVFMHAGVRHMVESQMVLHMLLQFPLLLLSGWAAVRAADRRGRLARCIARVDDGGLLCVTLLSCVAAFWMIPAALDLSVLDARVALCKYLSWIAAGALLACSRERIRPELGTFLLGNLAWMFATVGLLFRESESRLCVSYLASDQLWTGTGLVALSLALAAFVLHRVFFVHMERSDQPMRHA
jgi:hypothetical protein